MDQINGARNLAIGPDFADPCTVIVLWELAFCRKSTEGKCCCSVCSSLNIVGWFVTRVKRLDGSKCHFA